MAADPIPDLAGLRDAMERKRAALGEDVTFRWPKQRTYDPGVALNASGEPLDPTVQPTGVVQPEVTKHVGVAQGIGTIQRLSRETQATAAGRFERGDVLLICNLADAPDLDGATEFLRAGERHEIVGDRFDGVSGMDRYLIYGRTEGGS